MDYASNPKVGFDYEILETLEAGLVLKGNEVKSIKTGKASLKGAYVKMLGGEPYLVGALIPPYQPANTPRDYDPSASRKLLMAKHQISALLGLANERGLTLVPLKLYGERGLVKLLVGVAKGKKKYDKRETIKKRDVARARQRGIEES